MAVMNGQTSRGASTIAHEPIQGSMTGQRSRPAIIPRGACPSLAAPMMTGDGLLVRLRPASPGLNLGQFRQLAEAAARHGNGLIEITARGSLQMRGLKPQTMDAFADDLGHAGIVPQTGVAIETPSLSGLDPHEIADARRMAARLWETIAQLTPRPVLAPKLSVIVDGGGVLGLDAVAADIRLMAETTNSNASMWTLAINGTGRSARMLATLPTEAALSAVGDLLQMLSRQGPRARGRDLDAESLARRFPPVATKPGSGAKAQASPVGIHQLGAGGLVLGLRLPYGQIRSEECIAFLDIAERQGAGEIRMAPGHALLVLGLAPSAARAVQLAAANYGFSISADDPRSQIDCCAGAGACASAFYDTKAIAAACLGEAPDLFDGSLGVHLSGCPKGCAHPRPAALAVVGTPMGYGLVVNGSASDEPVAYIQKKDLPAALRRLDRLVENNKDAGESAGACLTRLDRNDIAAALRQG